MSEHTTREPVDGVMCLVWTDLHDEPRVLRFNATSRRWVSHMSDIGHGNVTHWTTLAEAKAAPAMLAVQDAAVHLLASWYITHDHRIRQCECGFCTNFKGAIEAVENALKLTTTP